MEEICQYLEKASHFSSEDFWAAVQGDSEGDQEFSIADLCPLTPVAYFAVQISTTGRVTPQHLLAWTRGYLQLCCQLSEPTLDNANRPISTAPSTSCIDKRREGNRHDPPNPRDLTPHASQFSYRGRRQFFSCALCQHCLTSEHCLREHWEDKHLKHPHFYYYWPYECTTCHGYLPYGTPRSQHSEICFGINGLGAIGPRVDSSYRWLFYAALAGNIE